MTYQALRPARNTRPAIFLKPIWILTLLLLLTSQVIQAQTIRGFVRDADNGEALTGATLSLRYTRGESMPLSMASSPTGEFAFEKIRPGYYSLEIVMQGFVGQTLTEINAVSGKEQVLEISLLRSNAQLAELTVVGVQPGRRKILPLGEIPLTRDQTMRFPAMFFDPARLATAYPGITQVDDGTNMISVRGNGPATIRWRLEGLDIVNPNHLANAGTFSDRPAAASGGVLMFSAQLLDNSSLLTGPMPAGYGDALGGVFDMNLRKGNDRHHEFTAQAGLIGLDMAAEGPLSGPNSNFKASYLVNYRYSTVGLLGQLGVSFGDEQINFQDLSFNLNLEGKRGSRWTLFGMGAANENIFKHKTDTAEIKYYKDFFDIDYSSRTGVIGATNWTPIGKNAWIKTAIAYSGQLAERTAQTESFTGFSYFNHIDETKRSASITYSQRFNSRLRFQTGVISTTCIYNGEAALIGAINVFTEQKSRLTQPWTQLNWQSRNQKNTSTLGLHLVLFDILNNDRGIPGVNLEPRFAFSRKLAENHKISFAAGVYSQTQYPWLNRYPDELLKTQKVELGYDWHFLPAWHFKTALYKQWINNAPFHVDQQFSLLNIGDQNMEFDFSSNINSARGYNQGVEFTVERTLIDGWFLLANASFFDSRFSQTSSPTENDWLSTRWNIRRLTNVTFGKEWQREKRPGKERTIGLNARLVWSGGIREADIDQDASKASNQTVISERIGYFNQYPDYFRVDLRVYWRKNLGNRRNSTFALDLQNLTAKENLAYHYFDPFTQQIENKYQLSTIPNFSWRLEF